MVLTHVLVVLPLLDFDAFCDVEKFTQESAGKLILGWCGMRLVFFFGPIVSALKQASRCKSYPIIRDIFPGWAVDMGLMGR